MKTKGRIGLPRNVIPQRQSTMRTAAAVLSLAAATVLMLAVVLPLAQAADADMGKPAIVLVHGAFADGSSWQHVIPLLQEDGYIVTAVQNPMTSLADDIATTKRAIEMQKGPVVLVGHSYGGMVITAAAAQNPNVKALVYIAAFAPDTGESAGALLKRSKAPDELGPALMPDAGGFLYINREKFHDVFAKDIPPSEARIAAATQKPIFGGIFETPVEAAGWKNIPSWCLVATEDHAISPDLERFMAKRINATTVEVKASHVAFISHPKEVVKLIKAAAETAAK